VPAYRSLVDELTRGARERTVRAAQSVLTTAGLDGWANEAGERVAQLAEEVGQASRANRELFEQVFAAEVGRAAGRVGLVPQADLREALDRLESLDEALQTTRFEIDELRHEAAEVPALRRELAELTLRVATLEAGVPDVGVDEDDQERPA
jgi:hypothetical protein